MDILTLFVMLAVAATVIALTSGIISMVVDHEIGHNDSLAWMKWRVGAQAVAFVLVLLALLKTAY